MGTEGTESRNGNNDDTNRDIPTSSNNDANSEGLNSRTQSYTSAASSQVSRSSRLPDYDFRDDDRPGKYKGGKKKDKKPDKTKAVSEKKEKKEKGDKSKKSDKTKQKNNKETENAMKQKEKKEKPKKEKKSKAKKENEPKVVNPEKKKKKTKNGDKNQAFQEELEVAVSQQKILDETSCDDVTAASLSTSRDPSVTSEKNDKKKKAMKKTKSDKKRGTSKTRKDKNKTKKGELPSQASSEISFTDVTSDYATDDASSDSVRKKKKTKKTTSPKKKTKNEDPVVVVVNDDDDLSFDSIKKRKMFLGICPIPSKREPLVYNCCMCCSLGAGSLISGIIFVLFCIGYLVIRAKEFQVRSIGGVWRGHHLLADVWRLLLVFGFITASLCLLASLLLVIGSCLWGSKDRYIRIRNVIAFWFMCATTALINNIGEAVFIQTMPNDLQGAHATSDSFKEIKENNVQLWAITGLFTLFFFYITLVLVSYLRLLKYMDLPKIGTTPTPAAQPSDSTKPNIATRTSSNRPSKSSRRNVETETPVKTVSERARKSEISNDIPKIPLRKNSSDNKWPRRSTDDIADQIYVNTSFLQEDETGPSPTKEKKKSDNFQKVLEDLKNDPNQFENISKPKPLKRIPIRKPRAPPVQDAIYMNHDLRPTTPSASYTKVAKPLKRTASLSDVNTPVYECPPPETDLRDIVDKKNRPEMRQAPYESGDTGFNSRSSVASSMESYPGINEMERLAEELREKQEALDKSGNCDPATAENLTMMAINALKLSERILQDVKSNENQRNTPMYAPEEERPQIQQNVRLAESFFDELSRDPNTLTENPIEEMFRMYGKDLCCQNPEMVNRYLMSYKALQEHKSRQQRNLPHDTGIDGVAMNEQKPWMSILNPSEAVPAIQPMFAMPPGSGNSLTSSISQSTMGAFHGEDPRLTHSAFTPTQPTITQPFHSLSHAQSGPPPANSFFPIDYPLQNSASYNQDPQQISQNSMVPYNGPPSYDQTHKFPNHAGASKVGFPHKRLPYGDEYYYDEECPYSCCYGTFDDYGSMYGEYGPYVLSDPIYGEGGMYTGPNWFPMGDPSYSIDPYNNPYEIWDEPAPPYTEESTSTAQRPTASSRGYDSKTGSSSRGYDSKAGSSSRYTGGSRDHSARTSSRASASRGYSYRSRSLPNLLDEDLYSERSLPSRRSSKSIHNLVKWGIDNDDVRDTNGRSLSRQSKQRTLSRGSSALQETTRDAFMKGYKAALKEALTTISAKKEGKSTRNDTSISSEDGFIEKLISQVSERTRSQSPDRPLSSRGSKMTRTISSDSRFSNGSRRVSREDRRSTDDAGKDSRHLRRSSSDRRSSRNMSRLDSRESEAPEKLSSALSRRTSKLSFRPASRPGQPLFDDYYDDYRSTSLVPPSEQDLDDFGFPKRKSSQNSVGFKSLKSGMSHNSEADDILSTFELMSSHGGRPSTRSRLSSRTPSHDMKETVRNHDDQRSTASYPYSENENHFYNKLNLEGAFPESVSQSQAEFERANSQERLRSSGDRSRSQSANRRRRDDGNEFGVNDRSGIANETRKNNKEIMWFMGDNDTEPIYSDYEGQWASDSLPSEIRSRTSQLSRSSSFPEQARPDSVGSSKRKSVTFDKRPRIKEVNYRRTSWN